MPDDVDRVATGIIDDPEDCELRGLSCRRRNSEVIAWMSCRILSKCHLGRKKIAIPPAGSEERIRRSGLDDPPLIEHHDAIGAPER
jgi:hypothetical protein